MADFAANLRRLMARQGLTLADVVERSGLDARTVKSILAGRDSTPHGRTLHRLAAGLGVEADELFQNPALLARRAFDCQTNPVVDEVIAEHPALFADWTAADFDELYSHFGVGGALSAEGALATARRMNEKREVHGKVAVLLETGEADVLRGIVDLLYEKVVVRR
jgi:transcriptional regulator with XRE-family HTH domain